SKVNVQTDVTHASLLSAEAFGISETTSFARLRGLLHSFSRREKIDFLKTEFLSSQRLCGCIYWAPAIPFFAR
ncbi:MAG: hypothetical protein ABR964_14270, partial [Tepidisphaeraceae bacterium]